MNFVGTNSKNIPLVNKLLVSLLALASTCFILTFVVCSVLRILYPYELEWMEGAIIDHIVRVMAGQSLYVAPTIEFVPFIYTPLYYYISAMASTVFGEGFFAARLVASLSTIGIFFLLYLIVAKETKDKLTGLITAGLFAATYEASGAWFDLARVDSLYLCFYLAAIYLLRFKTSPKYLLLSGLLLTFSYLTKQTALILIAPLLLYAIWQHRKLSLWIVLPAIVSITLISSILNFMSDGWYKIYVFDLPSRFTWNQSMYTAFWSHDILTVIPVLMILSLIYFFKKKAQGKITDNRLFYGVLLLSCVVAAWLGRLHDGGFLNDLMPAHMAFALVAGLGIHKLLTLSVGKPAIQIATVVAVGIQFTMLWYTPSKYLPSDSDRIANEAFVQAVSELKGDVFIPYHGYITRMAGKRSFCHKMAAGDVARSDSTMGNELAKDIFKAYSEKRFSAVILDAGWYPTELKMFYKNTGGVYTDPNAGYPITGLSTRPRYFFVPRKSLR